MTRPPTTAIRSYRIYLRDAENMLAQGHDIELVSDEDACEFAARMLAEQIATLAQRFGIGHGSSASCAKRLKTPLVTQQVFAVDEASP
jgi:hypothetical protein